MENINQYNWYINQAGNLALEYKRSANVSHLISSKGTIYSILVNKLEQYKAINPAQSSDEVKKLYLYAITEGLIHEDKSLREYPVTPNEAFMNSNIVKVLTGDFEQNPFPVKEIKARLSYLKQQELLLIITI